LTQLQNKPDILSKDSVADIHNEGETIRRLPKDALKRSNNTIEEVLGEPVDNTFRIEHCSDIATTKI
jgi:hypothetical protein